MSDDPYQQFLKALLAAGMAPARDDEIVPDDTWRSFQVAGDRKKKGRYRLAIDGDFGFGNFIYWSDGHVHDWHSRTTRKMSAEERKERKDRVARLKKERAAEMKREFAETAKKCDEIWDCAQHDPNHPYLQKKGISGTGTKVATYIDESGKKQENVLLIPMYKDGALTSLQRIWPGGFKAFWERGDVAGAYTAFVNENDSKENIVIVEGYATGDSVRRAMVDWPVIVAFNAGNLLAVAKTMRSRYKKARIIIAADNDQWTFNAKMRPVNDAGERIDRHAIPGDSELWEKWRSEGRMQNPGLDKALDVGAKVAGHVIFPDIDSSDPEKNTDFNDLEKLRGLEAVRSRILAATSAYAQQDSADGDSDSFHPIGAHNDLDEPPAYLSEAPMHDSEEISRLYGNEDEPPLPAVTESGELNLQAPAKKDDSWELDLVCDQNGLVKPNSLKNAFLFVMRHPRYRGLFCFDEFAQEKVITRRPPWHDEAHFEPRALRDDDKTRLAIDLESLFINVNLPNLSKILDAAIMSNRQNPAQAHFRSLVWDGVPRLNTWLREYCGCTYDDPEYVSAVGRKWLTAAVARVMRPGCKFDSMLILEGAQNAGKSTLLRNLATFNGRAYFDDTIRAIDLPKPTTVPKLQGCIIIELSEMSGFKKMSSDESKQVISTQYDRIVRKYANEPTMLPRQFVLAGSINAYAGYLDDPTGNRRYWPVKCGTVRLEAFAAVKEQLWAEAYDCYVKGEDLWLSDASVYEKADQAQRNRLDLHPWHSDLETLTEVNPNIIEQEDIWSALQINDRARRTRESQDIISKIMTQLGWVYKKRQTNNKRRYVWLPDSQPDLLDEMAKTESAPRLGEEISW